MPVSVELVDSVEDVVAVPVSVELVDSVEDVVAVPVSVSVEVVTVSVVVETVSVVVAIVVTTSTTLFSSKPAETEVSAEALMPLISAFASISLYTSLTSYSG